MLALTAMIACGSGYTGDFSRPITVRLTLDSDASSLRFVGFKNDAVPIAGHFPGLSGELDVAARRGWFEIDTTHLVTGNDQRDQNLRTHLFDAEQYPRARIDITEVNGAVTLPAVGESVIVSARAVLRIRGHETALDIPARMTRERRALRVQSIGPLILTRQQLGLDAPFATLKAVCGHAKLSGAVPVHFDLAFREVTAP